MNIALVRKKSSPDLNSKQKLSMICWAMQYYDHDKERIVDGGMKIIADRFSLSQNTIQKIFQQYREELAKGGVYPDMERQLTDEVKENIIDLHFLTEGQSPIGLFIEQYQSEFGVAISRSAMERYLKEIGASEKVIYLAPSLSNKQRFQRMDFVLSLIEHRGHGSFQFRKEVRIHVDEKWFFVQELKQKVRYLPCEERPKERTVIHKSHIEKIMFLAAIGRPETFEVDGVSHYWNGKIGIFPFVKWAPAKRNSKNRVKGTPVMEDISVDSVAYYDLMTREGGLHSTLKREAPFLKGCRIVIQHDGAKPHNGKGNRTTPHSIR